jgi:hypothetical protein
VPLDWAATESNLGTALGHAAVEHRRLAFLDDVAGPAHRCGRILVDDLADDEPVEQPADRGEVLLDRRCAVAMRQHLDIGRDMMRADFAKLNETLQLEPGEEAAHGDAIGGARIRVADMGGEEIDEAQRGPRRSSPARAPRWPAR